MREFTEIQQDWVLAQEGKSGGGQLTWALPETNSPVTVQQTVEFSLAWNSVTQ